MLPLALISIVVDYCVVNGMTEEQQLWLVACQHRNPKLVVKRAVIDLLLQCPAVEATSQLRDWYPDLDEEPFVLSDRVRHPIVWGRDDVWRLFFAIRTDPHTIYTCYQPFVDSDEWRMTVRSQATAMVATIHDLLGRAVQAAHQTD